MVGHVGGRVAVRDRAKIRARTERTESKVRWLLRGVGVGGAGGWWAWVHAMVFGAWRAGEQTAFHSLKHDSNLKSAFFRLT